MSYLSVCLVLLFYTSQGLMELTLLPKGAKGCQCIDGSSAGFYYESGLSNTWVINLEGGGHCSTQPQCQQRSQTRLGSSNNWNTDKIGEESLSTSSITNPDFYDAHHVLIPYCSGDWHTGTRTAATTQTWGYYFSGHLIIENIIDYLMNGSNPSILTAQQIMITGQSAGGLAVFHNLDFIASKINAKNPAIKVKGVPIAGWQFAGNTTDQLNNPRMPPNDYPHWLQNENGGEGHDNYEPNLYNSYMLNSCTEALHKSGDEIWHCISVHNLYPFIKTEMLILQNKFDSNVITSNFEMPHLVSNNTKDYVSYFGNDMDGSILTLVAFSENNKNGLFYASCYDHVDGLSIDNKRSTTIVDGINTTQLVGDWFYERNKLSHIVYDKCSPPQLPCNPTCTSYA